MARMRSDSGFALLEVIVSAAVLAMIALAILAGIDGASASSGREKARAVAASLAEADQERLRALPVATLAQVATTAPYVVADPTGGTKTVDGVKYTVVSKAQFVADDSGNSASCTTSDKTTQYFHISSTVTSNVIGATKRVPPVTLDSVRAPNVAYSSTKGTLVVHVVDGNKNPLPGKLVGVTGGLSSQTTNSLGCAVWEQVPVATGGTPYTASLSDPAFVDQSGKSAATATVNVMPGKINSVTMSYDRPATVAANVYTYAPGGTPASPGAKTTSYAYQVSATNSSSTDTTLMRTWPTTAGAELAAVTADHVFPFTTAYTYFTGNCHYNDPTTSAYGNTTTAIKALLAGQQQPASQSSVDVYQPPLNVAITKNAAGNTPTTAMTVDVIPVAPSTDTCVQPKLTFSTYQVGTTWKVGRSYTGGKLDAGAPYGKYKLCFHDTIPSGTRKGNYTYAPSSYPNASPAATTSYDNTTPPTGQGTLESFAPATTAWTLGTTCP